MKKTKFRLKQLFAGLLIAIISLSTFNIPSLASAASGTDDVFNATEVVGQTDTGKVIRSVVSSQQSDSSGLFQLFSTGTAYGKASKQYGDYITSTAYQTVDEIPAFCINPERPFPIDEVYQETISKDTGLASILYYGWHPGDSPEFYVDTYVALNWYLSEKGLAISDMSEAKKADSSVQALYQHGICADAPFGTFEVGNSSQSSTWNASAGHQETDWYTTNPAVSGHTYTFTVPDGISVITSDGQTLMGTVTLNTGVNFKLATSPSYAGTVNIDLAPNFREAVTQVFIPDDETYQRLVCATEGNPISASISAAFTQQEGYIQVVKQDKDTKMLLSGAKFNIVNSADQQVTAITTNENGVAKTAALPLGQYKVVEVEAPYGYVLSEPVSSDWLTIIPEGTVEYTAENNAVVGHIKIIKTDSENGALISDAEFDVVNANGQVVDHLITKNGEAYSKALPLGDYQIKETKPAQGYLSNTEITNVSLVYQDQLTPVVYVEKAVTNQIIKGKIQIVKIDNKDNETPLAGAEFSVYKKDDMLNPVCKVTSDQNGFARTPDLRYGEYVIVETKAPKGYQKNEGEYPIFIKEDNQTYVQYISNKPIELKLKVIKFDAWTKEPMAGVKFQIQDSSGKTVSFSYQDGSKVVTTDTMVTDQDGMFITPLYLPYGDYQLVETETLAGYLLADPIPFSVNEDSKVITMDVIGDVIEEQVGNQPITGDWELTKLDMSTEAPIPNVTFELYQEDGTLVASKVTDDQGKIVIKNLRYGKYYFIEKDAPIQYVVNPEKHYFIIKTNGEIVKSTVTNRLKISDVELSKTDIGGAPVAGATIELYKEDGTLVHSQITDETGKFIIKELPYGKYYFIETNAPEGFLLNEEKHPFEVTKDGEIIKCNIVNERITGSLLLHKVDSQNEAVKIEGVEFTVYDLSGKEIAKGKTDVNGNLEFSNLPYGKYSYQETAAAPNYQLHKELFTFEISEHGVVIEKTITNDGITTVILSKADIADGNVKIPNAEFTIFNEKGEVVAKGMTDKNGDATFHNLPYGKYTYKETIAPKGYLINEETFSFEITKAGDIIKHTVYDQKAPVLPKTGADQAMIWMIGIGCVAMLGGVSMLVLRRKNNDQ